MLLMRTRNLRVAGPVWTTDASSPARATGWEGDGQRHTALTKERDAAGAADVQHGRKRSLPAAGALHEHIADQGRAQDCPHLSRVESCSSALPLRHCRPIFWCAWRGMSSCVLRLACCTCHKEVRHTSHRGSERISECCSLRGACRDRQRCRAADSTSRRRQHCSQSRHHDSCCNISHSGLSRDRHQSTKVPSLPLLWTFRWSLLLPLNCRCDRHHSWQSAGHGTITAGILNGNAFNGASRHTARPAFGAAGPAPTHQRTHVLAT